MRRYEDLDDLQQKAIDALYNNDERLALLETGFGKTVVAMTAGEELRAAGVIKHPLVFAPLRVATNTWPNERHEWEHLQHVEMVEWGGPPDEWAPSLWRTSRELYGGRLSIEGRLPNVEGRVRARLNKERDDKVTAVVGTDDKQHAQHVIVYYTRKFEPNPNQIHEAITAVRRPMEEKLALIVAEERRVNKEIRKTLPPEAWHVTSMENLEWLLELYEPGKSPFDLWIVDETGRLARNPTSPRYKALKKHMPEAKIRWGLNATPAPEGALDLFGQVQIVCGKRLWGKSYYKWRQKYFTPADYMGYSYRLQLGAFDLLMQDLNKVAFRAPATAYTKNATVREIVVDLPEKARAAYAEMEKTMAVELSKLDLGDDIDPVVAMSEAAASQKLRQIVQGYLYEVDDKGKRTVHTLHDEKVQALAELIESMGREPLLVAYQFDQDLENIRRIWKNVPYLGQGVSSAQASENIDRWNKRELPVLAIHPNSASHGLNLQYGGHHIAWLALPWSLDGYKQSVERLDRRGQVAPVFSHHILARDTIDERVSAALVEKDEAQNKLIAAIRKL